MGDQCSRQPLSRCPSSTEAKKPKPGPCEYTPPLHWHRALARRSSGSVTCREAVERRSGEDVLPIRYDAQDIAKHDFLDGSFMSTMRPSIAIEIRANRSAGLGMSRGLWRSRSRRSVWCAVGIVAVHLAPPCMGSTRRANRQKQSKGQGKVAMKTRLECRTAASPRYTTGDPVVTRPPGHRASSSTSIRTRHPR